MLDSLPTECVLLDQYSARNVGTRGELLTEAGLLGRGRFTKFFLDEFPKSDEYFLLNDLR